MATTIDNVQIALEQTPRYEGAPTTTPYQVSTDVHYLPVQSAALMAAPSYIDRVDEMRGTEGGPPVLIEGYAPAATVAMRGYLDSMTWFLTAAGLVPTYTVGNGVITDPDGSTIPTGANRWVWSKRTGLTAKSLQLLLSYASRGVFLRGQGFGVNQITLNAEGAFGASLMGLVFQDIADPNLTPSFATQAIWPIRRGDFTLTWLAGSGTTDDFSMTLTNPLVRRRTMALATPSFFPDVLEQDNPKVNLTGTIPKSMMNATDVDAMLAATSFAAKARWKTVVNVGASAYKYSMWIEMPKCQIVGGDVDPISNSRRFGASWNWDAQWDEASGYDFKITIVNAVASITAGTPTLTL